MIAALATDTALQVTVAFNGPGAGPRLYLSFSDHTPTPIHDSVFLQMSWVTASFQAWEPFSLGLPVFVCSNPFWVDFTVYPSEGKQISVTPRIWVFVGATLCNP